MSTTQYAGLMELCAGVILACGVVALWRRDLSAIVVVLAVQGVSLSALAGVLAVRDHSFTLGVVACVVLIGKGTVIPVLLSTVASRDPRSRESQPLVNVSASLVTAALLVVLAYLSAGQLSAIFPDASSRLAPIGLATVLVGFFFLVTRRKAVSQIVGLLLIDNGVALVAFLLTAGVPFLIELGASLDVLLVVVVLQVLATTMRSRFGHIDLDQLRELHD